jgi:hypothetical protein
MSLIELNYKQRSLMQEKHRFAVCSTERGNFIVPMLCVGMRLITLQRWNDKNDALRTSVHPIISAPYRVETFITHCCCV